MVVPYETVMAKVRLPQDEPWVAVRGDDEDETWTIWTRPSEGHGSRVAWIGADSLPHSENLARHIVDDHNIACQGIGL